MLVTIICRSCHFCIYSCPRLPEYSVTRVVARTLLAADQRVTEEQVKSGDQRGTSVLPTCAGVYKPQDEVLRDAFLTTNMLNTVLTWAVEITTMRHVTGCVQHKRRAEVLTPSAYAGDLIWKSGQ